MEEDERKAATTPRERTPASSSSTSSTSSASTSSSAAATVPERQPGDGARAAHGDADKLDVCSERFDPLLALYSPTVSVPFPKIRCFNNVSEYESFLRGGRGRAKPENAEKKRLRARRGVADPERIQRLKLLMVNNPTEGSEGGSAPRGRRQKPQKNVLTRMPLCEGSPLGELYRCVQERVRVKVHIRTFKGLRGVCSGFVVAFDKYWNMAMVDVDETYREPLWGEAFYHEKALTISRLFDKLKLQESPADDQTPPKPEAAETAGAHPPARDATTERGSGGAKLSDGPRPQNKDSRKACSKKDGKAFGKVHTRHINQLFIRGENVILVNPQRL